MPERKGAHLNIDDRYRIEDMIKCGFSFREIARRLNVSPTTVSSEVRRNRIRKLPPHMTFEGSRRCVHYRLCSRRGVCGSCRTPERPCKDCRDEDCYSKCPVFATRRCPHLDRPPYVCNFCHRRQICDLGKAFYSAPKAQQRHDQRASCTHAGITCKPAQLKEMVEKVRSLLSQGHSLEAIWAVHGEEFPVSVRTFYTYMDKGVMGLANIELPKKVRYRQRRRKGGPRMELVGRTYADWQALPEIEQVLTVQMDCIEGVRTDRKAVLSLHFPRLLFQLYILLEAKTQECVIAAIDWLEERLEGSFADVFGVLLADRGSEFLDFEGIEGSIDGLRRRCRIFYCDPMKPSQKGAAEKNHVEYRKIVPKGTSIDGLTQSDISLVCSHVNSYPRAARGQAPIKLAKAALPACLLESLGVEEIAPDEVVMTPELIMQNS